MIATLPQQQHQIPTSHLFPTQPDMKYWLTHRERSLTVHQRCSLGVDFYNQGKMCFKPKCTHRGNNITMLALVDFYN